MPSRTQSARRVARALRGNFQSKRHMARAIVTAVQRDEGGRAIGATATIDGLSAQSIQIDHGSTITEGDVFEVENHGGVAGPAWFAVRRISTTIPVPSLPYGTQLPVPTGLALTTGSYIPAIGSGSVSWIYATFRTIADAYGAVNYECQYRRNDMTEDEEPTSLVLIDPKTTAELLETVNSGATTIPRLPTSADFDFPKSGIIQIEKELIYYSLATRRAGIWLYPSALTSTTLQLYSYVEDAFTDTDSTNITAHTPDYDRQAGGWYVIPTYSSNWAISSNAVVATPGGTWPYSAAIITTKASSWAYHRLRGDWTFPSSGQFGYIIDYVDASNFVYVRYDMTNTKFEIVERISASENTVWEQADDTLAATETYTFTVNTRGTSIYITISGGDLSADISYEAANVLTGIADSPKVGIWSDVAVTLDNFYADDARESPIVDDEWINYVYLASGYPSVKITDNGYNPTTHIHVITTLASTTVTGGTIYPAFVNCTRGYLGTTAAGHQVGVGVYSQGMGFLLQPLVGGVDYNVRLRAFLSTTVYSAWSDWATILSAEDSSAPDAPDNLTAYPLVNGVRLTWDEYTSPSPDLAGFKIYRSTESDGSNPETVGSTTGYELFASSAAGEVYYYNIKAYDFTGNFSAYGEATWVEAYAVYTDGSNLITNTDFERDLDGDGEADQWTEGNSTYGTYGLGGGKGYRLDPPAVTVLPQVGYMGWDPADNGFRLKAVEGQYLLVSAYFKPDNPATMFLGYSTSETACYPAVFFSNGSTPWGGSILTPGQDDYYGYESLADGWYRIWGRHKVTASDISSTPYVGVILMCYAMGGDRYCDTDRVQLELGYEPSQWKPNLVPPSDGSGIVGLRFDTQGVVSDGFTLNADGELVSDLEPAADDTYWLGSDNNWKGLTMADGITVPSGVSGDAILCVDTNDGRLKIRHGTGTPVDLEEGWVYVSTPYTSTSWDGDSHSTTAKTTIDLSSVFGIPAGVKAILAGVSVRDSASSTTDTYLVLSPNDTANQGLSFNPLTINDRWNRYGGITIPCDSNGDVYYQIAASGSGTFDVYIEIWGYLL